MRKRILFFLAALVIMIAAGISTTFILSKPNENQKGPQSFVDPIDKIRQLKRSGALETAYDTAAVALKNDATRSDIAFEAGLLSVILGQPEQANTHMRHAWDLGHKNLTVLLVLIDTHEAPRADRVEVFERLFSELEPTSENRNAKGRFYSRYGLHDKALETWRQLRDETGDEAVLLQMARKLEVIGRREEAILLLQKQDAESKLGAKGYNLLISLLVFDNKFEDAQALIYSTAPEDPHGEWAFKRAMFSLLEGNIPQAGAELSALAEARSDHPVSLTIAHEARICVALLRVIQMGALADLEDLKKIWKHEVATYPPRVITTPMLGVTADPKELEGERLLYDFLTEIIEGNEPSERLFVRIESLLKESPAIRWLSIRNALTKNRPFDAVALYTEIESVHPLEHIEGPAGFFYKSPLFVTEAARAFYQDNKPREALTLLNHLHERDLHSPTTIRLFAKIMEETGESENLEGMQQALSRQFKDDLGVQMTLVNQAYQKGDTDEALAMIDPLLKANETSVELQMLQLMLLLDKEEIQKVLETCENSDLPERNRHLVRARVALKTGDTDGAESSFKQAINAADFFAYLDYARFLVEQKRIDEAAKLYSEVLKHQPDNIVALQGQAITEEMKGKPTEAIGTLRRILQLTPDDTYTQSRLAKLQLQTESPKAALRTANKVLAEAPDNSDARYLQITAMIQLALSQSVPAVQQRNLMKVKEHMRESYGTNSQNPQFFLYVYLAAAFREVGLPDESGEIYRDLLALNESIWSNTNLQRQDVQQALEALNE